MQSSELQRRAAGNADWLARLRGKDREGWNVEDQNWECSGSPAATGHELRGAVVRSHHVAVVTREAPIPIITKTKMY